MRNRAWRRYMEERIVIRRIRTTIYMRSYWRYFQDVNGYGHNPALLKDLIGINDFIFKTRKNFISQYNRLFFFKKYSYKKTLPFTV